MSLDLKKLRYFLVLTEELHYRRAAARLGIAQPPVSAAIATREESLGTQLLERDRRSVRLTPAGQALAKEAAQLIAKADAAERLVKRVAGAEVSRIRLGFVPWSVMKILPRSLLEFRKQWPQVKVRIDEQMSRSQVEALREGSLDLGILNRNLVETRGLQLHTLETTHLVAVVPARWPIGKLQHIRLQDLARHPFLVFPNHWVPNYFAAFKDACRQAGFIPKVAQYVGQPYTMFNLVANGLGVGLVQDTARHLKMEGVTLLDIVDLAKPFWSEIALAHVKQTLSPPVAALKDILVRNAQVRAK